MKENNIIGNLIGTTKPNLVKIIIDPNVTRNQPMQIGEYVIIDYPKNIIPEQVLGLIVELGLINENIPENIVHSPEEYQQLTILGDLSKGEKLTASARVIGYFNKEEKIIEMPRFPPIPGASVYRADSELLKEIFSAGQVEVGKLRAHPDVEVKVDINELVRRHTAILAITGAGKGNTVAILTTGILALKGSVIIIDPHEEYPEMRSLYKKQIKVFSPKGNSDKGYYPICFKWRNFSQDEILEILEIQENASKQTALIREALNELLNVDWDITDLNNTMDRLVLGDESIRQNPEKQKEYWKKTGMRQYIDTRFAVQSHIAGIKASDVLNKSLETPITGTDPCLVKQGQITIISVSGLPTGVQQVVVGRLAKRLYECGVAWRRNEEEKEKLPCPTLLVVEEAHNFIPNGPNVKSSHPLQRIAAEGRKFGIGLCIVSQRPGRVDSNVLSQCNSQIILRIVNPNDQSQIQQSSEAITQDLLNDLPSLNKGEAVIVGPCLLIPALVKIDKYKGARGGDDIDIVKYWEEESKSKLKPEVQDFKDKGNLFSEEKWDKKE